MKHFVLPVLMWTLAISQTFAQKSLAPSIEAYANHAPAKVQHLLNLAGFTENNQSNEETKIETRSSELQLDSTVTFHLYSANDSVPQTREYYFYPEPRQQKVIQFGFQNNAWHTLSRSAIFKDELGRIVEVISHVYDESIGNYIPESRLRVYPYEDSPSLIDSFFVEVYNEETDAFETQLSTWNTYDSQDRLTESLSAVELFQLPIYFVDRYTYNAEGNLAEIASFNIDGEEEFPGGRQEFTYEGGKVKTHTTYTSDGVGGEFPESREEYVYFTSGTEENINYYLWDFEKNDWKIYRADAFLYDNEHRQIQSETNQEDGTGIWNRSKTTFTYKQDQFVEVEASFVYDQIIDDWAVTSKKFYYYNELTATDEPIIADAVFLYPNPTNGTVQVKLDGKVSLHVYTLTGQLLKNIYLEGGNKTAYLNGLPAGVYTIRAKSNENYYADKLVIQ